MPKILWGKWSFKFDYCQSCGTSDRPHMAKGLCKRCYNSKLKRDKIAYLFLPIPLSPYIKKYNKSNGNKFTHFLKQNGYYDIVYKRNRKLKELRGEIYY